METKNIGQLINALATKAGVNANDKNLVNILSNAELTKMEIHSDLAKAIDENLLSLEAAKDNHPAIGTVYKAQALNGFDKAMQRVIDESDFDDETKSVLSNEKSSYKRFESIVAKIKELQSGKQAASGKADKDAYQKQIDELQKEVRETKESLKNKESEFAVQRKNDLIDFKLRNLLNAQKTVFDDLDADIKYASLKSAIDKELSDKDAKWDLDDKSQLILLRNDGTKVFGQNNVEIKSNNLIDSTLAANKLLKVTEPPKPLTAAQSRQPVPPGTEPPPKGTNQAMIDYNKQVADSFAKN